MKWKGLFKETVVGNKIWTTKKPSRAKLEGFSR